MKISKNICPVIFSRNSHVLTFLRIRQNSNYIITAPIQSWLPQIWSWPISYIHRDPFMWRYQKKLPRDNFKKFPCTNSFENSSKIRTSLYLLRFSPDCPKYSRDQIHISIGSHLCENIRRNFSVKFSWNSRVLTPLRIRQKLELHYINYDSVPTAPNMVVTRFIYP